ncbi:DeoR/GlpR family DNA-binding transcription regulator [Caviibacter abscessus]|uniref:DeoR/GlpR family DNA-binding transcription regulator n=1 Tax=Caviibacter abscessus TaxID=1766719 RepID=UPI00082B0DDE|nr:DeoR/GlpR family DNA-binding transcription regulator [Caviibacter abscessus]
MIEKERHDIILSLLKNREYITYAELFQKINLSESTIRRDVDKMNKLGIINKIKGGIENIEKLKYDISFNQRISEHNKEKKKICENAKKYIKNGDLIYLDAGSTTYELIEYLRDKDICVVTNGLMHIEKLLSYNINTVIICGKIKMSTKAIVGNECLSFLDRYIFDVAFLGVNGISETYGLTTPDIQEGLIKEKVITQSKKTIVLADSSKLNKVSNIKFGNYDDVLIITENGEIK